MKPRVGIGIFWGLLTVAVAGVVAFFAYHAGLSQAPLPAGTDPAMHYYYRGDFGIGGLFGLILLVFFISFLFRARRWGGHHWGGPWGYGRGWYGNGMPGGPGQPGDPGSWSQGNVPPVIEERLRSWHDRAHGTATAEPAGTPPGTAG